MTTIATATPAAAAIPAAPPKAPEERFAGDELNEFFARQHGIDGAVRRKAALTHGPKDVMVLEVNGIVGPRFEAERDRIKGVDYRMPIAGSPKRYAAKLKAKADATAKRQSLEATHGPEIAELQRKIDEKQAKITAAQNDEKRLAEELGVMDGSRALLMDRLLPESLRDMLGQVVRPIRQKYRPRMKPHEDVVTAEQGKINCGMVADRPQLERARRDLQGLEAQMKAEIEAAGNEIRAFYLNVIED